MQEAISGRREERNTENFSIQEAREANAADIFNRKQAIEDWERGGKRNTYLNRQDIRSLPMQERHKKAREAYIEDLQKFQEKKGQRKKRGFWDFVLSLLSPRSLEVSITPNDLN